MKMSKQNIIMNILAYCFDGDADLRTVVSVIEIELPKLSNKEVQKYTLEIIKQLLSEKLIIAGRETRLGTFKKWNLKVEKVMDKIRKDWNEIERQRELLLGDVVWFILTEKGIKECEYLNKSQLLQLF